MSRVYEVPGRKNGYPSVTTIIKTAWPSGALENWKVKNLAKNVVANVDTLIPRLEKIRSRPERIQKLSHEGLAADFLKWREDTTAANRGTRVHEGLELLLRGEATAKKLKKKMEKSEYVDVISAACALDRLGFTPLLIEVPVYSHTHKYAGTADLIGEYARTLRGKKRTIPAVLDLKTGKRIHRHFSAQLAAYRNAEEMRLSTGDMVPMFGAFTGLVLHVTGGTTQFYRCDLTAGWADFRACLRIYESAKGRQEMEKYDV